MQLGMSLLPKAALAVGILLIILGIVGGGGGAYRAENICKSGWGLSIEQLDEVETPDPEKEKIAYENLSTEQQQVFKEILNSEGSLLYDDPDKFNGLIDRVITYNGTRYETSGPSHGDCFSSGAHRYLVAGSLVVLSGVGTASLGWKRMRHQS